MDFSEYKDANRVFYYFEEISKIPHGSGNTDKIADFLTEFAAARALFSHRDKFNNVIIKKPATRGYESCPTVILQGHTDMVIAKEPGVERDLNTLGPELFKDGDFLRAKGTTLGADDGIAVAYMLALLEAKDIPHPALECVFTSDEEIGLIGAAELDTSLLDGRIMINIDSDDEGVFTAGCAGGMRIDITLDTEEPKLTECYKLSVSGLLGGHSGVEIDKGHINAIKLLGELIPDGAMIGSISGGNADNAIPRNVQCYISECADMPSIIEAAIKKYSESEPSIKIEYERAEKALLMSKKDSERVLNLIRREPYGPVSMNKDIPTLVETSLNLGVISTDKDSVTLTISVRSSKDSEKDALAERVCAIAGELGGKVNCHGSYPGWEYRSDSRLREILVSVYERLFSKKASVVTIHAGLECGIFAGKLEGLDCISLGPDSYDIHTPEERLSLSSTERVWKLLKEALKAI